MRHLISFVLVTGGLVLAPRIGLAQGEQESPPAPAVRDHYPFTPSHDWLPQVKSLRLTAETRWQNRPEEIERRRRSLGRPFSDLEDPDPLEFGLLPIQMSTDIYAYDQSRLRASSLTRTEDGVALSSHCGIWDGKRCIDHWHWFRTNQNDVGVMPKADRYYIGSHDGRWYGAKIGIHVASGGRENRPLDRLGALEEFLGHPVAPSERDKAWQSLDSLPQDKKEAWCRRLYDRCGRHVVPCWEYWFSDFRDLGGNRILLYRQDFVHFTVWSTRRTTRLAATRTRRT